MGYVDPGESPDFLSEIDEHQPEVSREDKQEMEAANEEFKKIYREIGDGIQYQNLHYMIPLKTRMAPEVEAAIRLMFVQLRSDGLPLQRVHSDRARELRGQGIRRWLLERDVYPTTGEAQAPQSNGRAELVVKMMKKKGTYATTSFCLAKILLAFGNGTRRLGAARICSRQVKGSGPFRFEGGYQGEGVWTGWEV